MKKNKKRIFKQLIGWLLGLGGATIFSVGVALTCNANLGSWTRVVMDTTNDNSLTAGQIAGIGFCIGLFLGVTILIWYPISRLLAWAKTRKLTNQNLEADLKLKEKQLLKEE